jgi:hypothetical protein
MSACGKLANRGPKIAHYSGQTVQAKMARSQCVVEHGCPSEFAQTTFGRRSAEVGFAERSRRRLSTSQSADGKEH